MYDILFTTLLWPDFSVIDNRKVSRSRCYILELTAAAAVTKQQHELLIIGLRICLVDRDNDDVPVMISVILKRRQYPVERNGRT